MKSHNFNLGYKTPHNSTSTSSKSHDGRLLEKILWRLDLWASMKFFNGDFQPWICSGRYRRRDERRHHPLGNKPWIRSLERKLQWMKRMREREREREGGARHWRRKKREESEKQNLFLVIITHKYLVECVENKEKVLLIYFKLFYFLLLCRSVK